jgi:hypothetical protein
MSTTLVGPLLPKEGQRLKALTAALDKLQTMNLHQLRAEHLRLLGFEARSKNLVYLHRRIAWRLNELVDGGLSSLASTRLQALMPEALPVRRPRSVLDSPRPASQTKVSPPRDPRLPPEGTVLERTFHGVNHEVEIVSGGFQYRGTRYPSLSTIAKAITGTSWNGFLFFHLQPREASDATPNA